MSIQTVLIFIFGFIIGAVIFEPDEPETINTIEYKVQEKTVYLIPDEIKGLHFTYWLLGYKKGADAMAGTANGGRRWIEQYSIDSLAVQQIINGTHN